jgi:hypothetical protein
MEKYEIFSAEACNKYLVSPAEIMETVKGIKGGE